MCSTTRARVAVTARPQRCTPPLDQVLRYSKNWAMYSTTTLYDVLVGARRMGAAKCCIDERVFTKKEKKTMCLARRDCLSW